MRLYAWNTVWRDIEFDPATGAARVIKLREARPDTSTPTGFAQLERSVLGVRHVFALFRDGDRLFFSADARRWELGPPELRLVHTRSSPLFSRFRVLESDRETFSILYGHLGRLLFALVDPTYDGIDEETDFFLQFVAEHAQSPEWQAAVRERWGSAPAA